MATTWKQRSANKTSSTCSTPNYLPISHKTKSNRTAAVILNVVKRPRFELLGFDCSQSDPFFGNDEHAFSAETKSWSRAYIDRVMTYVETILISLLTDFNRCPDRSPSTTAFCLTGTGGGKTGFAMSGFIASTHNLLSPGDSHLNVYTVVLQTMQKVSSVIW